MSHLCLNVCTLTPAPESSGHIATYIPILYLMSALCHLWCIRQQVSFPTSNQRWRASFTHVVTHQLGESFFCRWTKDEKWHLIKSPLSLKKDHKQCYMIIPCVCVCVSYSNLSVHCTRSLRSTQALWSLENLQTLQIEVCHMSRWLQEDQTHLWVYLTSQMKYYSVHQWLVNQLRIIRCP